MPAFAREITSAALLIGGMLLLISPVTAAPKAAKPFSDHFTKDSVLNPGWTLEEPNPASSYKLSKKGLLLDASGQNGGSDLWPATNYNASLLLQPIKPSLNWTITIDEKFAPLNYYQGAGIVLTTQTTGFTTSSVFHRFEYANNPVQGLESFTNGQRDSNYAAYSGKFVLIRLQKSGSTYTYSYSPNGMNWTVVSTLTDTEAYTYVGLISVRYPYDGMTNVDARPQFKYFEIKINH